MGFKALFSMKKKQGPDAIVASIAPSLGAISRSSSVAYRAQMEEELKQVFKKFDVNGDGKISSSELGSMLGNLGHPATDEELNKMIRDMDKDGDGFIDLAEFIELNTKDLGSDDVLDSLREAFLVFDIDKNGSISAEELQNVLKSLGDDCSIAECRRMISGVDSNGDGIISFEEFKVMMIRGSRFDAMDAERTGGAVEID
ncbi:probable calcium-binding protein CML25 [Impatiens glandulifera]|uniref:probable calcium-binding protein CML25 n=1 Tax=Impatiens glandulifera TaxID=253017 RepID=UPI001FB11C87|nr:probable calcium-binding protein CML25 [Impatiens glandulifera]